MTKARDIANNSSAALAAAALPKSGGALTGAVTTNSTFDGRDVASDGVLATNALPKSGGALTGNVTFGDNNKAILGAGSDLQIYHDGSNSYVDDAGTGRLFVRGNDRVMIQKYTGEDMVSCLADGAVKIYYDNAKKFETSASGVTVIGTAAMDGLTVDSGSVYHKLITTFPSTYVTNLQIGQQGSINTAANTDTMTFAHSGAEAVSDFLFTVNNSTKATITGTGKVLINTTTEGQNQADNLTVSDSGNMGMTLRSTNSGECSIFFSDATSGAGEYAGSIQYLHSADSTVFATAGTERMRISNTGNVMIGSTNSGNAGTNVLNVGNPGVTDGGIQIWGRTNASSFVQFGDSTASADNYRGYMGYFHASDELRFGTASTDRVFLNSSGTLIVGEASVGAVTNGQGTYIASNGQLYASSSSSHFLNKQADGDVLIFRSQGDTEGSVSISGSTTSYNAFSGSHWSRLSDNSKPTILKGTVMEPIDTMVDWYQAQFTVAAQTEVNEDEETVEVKASYVSRDSITLPDGASVGDIITHTSNGITYDNAVIILESDNKHPKCKISDTADSTRVYGVFADWNQDVLGGVEVNDMYITAVGTHVVRVHGGQTVAGGDLLVSNGDGTAKVQDDDIIRSKTLGKVLTNIKQETYADDSYTVPCALYCG